ncbi:protein containing DUF1571 [Rhodopirellula sallentina SM41]|uniref:Protein containing DUF1571 n=2 Tax=Rhodopirellula TaxID=265488 RepID=M5TVC5_9BACT|nr:protein containing DUF1571 [Rhodopirellula sallentina SM41]
MSKRMISAKNHDTRSLPADDRSVSSKTFDMDVPRATGLGRRRRQKVVGRALECLRGWVTFGVTNSTREVVACLLFAVLWAGVAAPGLADDRNIPDATARETEETELAASVAVAEVDSKAAEEDATEEDEDDDAPIQPVESIGPGKKPPESLQPLIELAEEAKKKFETEVDGYTCLLVKRETIDGKLESTKYIRLKIRERRFDGKNLLRPQCIYGKFLKPKSVAGRELLYVENERDGDVLVRRGGTRLPNLTLEIDPDGRLAKQESNHSIVQTGIRPMIEQILDRLRSQIDPENVKIRFYADAKVDGRPCQHIEVRQIEQRPHSTYQVAKVYVDEELKLPVFFSSYAWPDEPEAQPVLQEQYAITQIKLNPKLTDLDFDRTNPEYKFRNEDESTE